MNTIAEFYEWVLQSEKCLDEYRTRVEEVGEGAGNVPQSVNKSDNFCKEMERVVPSPNFHRYFSSVLYVRSRPRLSRQPRAASSEVPHPSLCHNEESESSDDSFPFILEDLSLCSNDSPTELSSNKFNKRRVDFLTVVQVREYSLTVGDHPSCEGPLPLSLDWQHADFYYWNIEDSKERNLFSKGPRRLSARERLERLIAVAGYNKIKLDYLTSLRPEIFIQNEGALHGLMRRSWLQLSRYINRHTDAYLLADSDCSANDEDHCETSLSAVDCRHSTATAKSHSALQRSRFFHD